MKGLLNLFKIVLRLGFLSLFLKLGVNVISSVWNFGVKTTIGAIKNVKLDGLHIED